MGNLLNKTILLICFKSGFPSLFKSKEKSGTRNACPNDVTSLSTLPATNHVSAVAITVYFTRNSFKLFACFMSNKIKEKKIHLKKRYKSLY